MAKAKKGKMAKVKNEVAVPAKMTKDMKASVDKIIAKVQEWASKKFATIEKQLEKTKGAQAKPKMIGKKVSKKTKFVNIAKKNGKSSKKKSNTANQTEAA